MLLSPRRDLRIVLCPGKVIVAAYSTGLRRKLASKAILPIEATNSTDWRPVVAALEGWLDENGVRKADAKIYLSSCFVRFAMMPFTEGVNDYAERMAVAGLLFESIYGEAAKQWKLTLDEEQYGEPCLVGAIDAGLAEAIEQLVTSRKFRTTSVLPYAVSVLNTFSKQINGGEGLLAVVDNGQAVLIDIREKKITGIRKVMLSIASDGQEVANTLRREMLISGLNAETVQVYLHIAGEQREGIPAVSELNVIPLRQAVKEKDQLAGDYAMACVENMP